MVSRLRAYALAGTVAAFVLLLLLTVQLGMTTEGQQHIRGRNESAPDAIPDQKACLLPTKKQQRFNLPPKGCPAKPSVVGCLADNRNFTTFPEAWAACGATSECGVIMRAAAGRYYLRRSGDPDFPRGSGGTSMKHVCQEQDTKPKHSTATTTWTGSVFVLDALTTTTTTKMVKRKPKPKPKRKHTRNVRAPDVSGDNHSATHKAAAIQHDGAVEANGQCKAQNPKIDQVIARIACSDFPQRWDRCALVGGSTDLLGKGLGPAIDRHDTVIRVNRVPTEEYFKDFGNRTDVFFAGAKAEGRHMYNLAGQYFRSMGGSYHLCEFSAEDCPFRALVLKGVDHPRHPRAWESKYPCEKPGWRPEADDLRWPLGYQGYVLNTFAFDLLEGDRPTNGFHAFLTFLLACEELDVYGFSGGETADGHKMSAQHKLGREHEIMAWLAFGKIASTNKRGKEYPKEFVDHIRSSKRRGHVRLVHAGGG